MTAVSNPAPPLPLPAVHPPLPPPAAQPPAPGAADDHAAVTSSSTNVLMEPHDDASVKASSSSIDARPAVELATPAASLKIHVSQKKGSSPPGPLALVVKRSGPLQLSKELRDPLLLAARDEPLEGAGHGGFLGGFVAHAKGTIQQGRVEGEVRGHASLLTDTVRHRRGCSQCDEQLPSAPA